MTQHPKPKRRKINFSMDAPDADSVYLTGDFNSWDHQKHPLKRNKKGVWQKAVMLLPGRYEYRFLVDGRWANDLKNNQTCPNCFGTQNNIIIVTAH